MKNKTQHGFRQGIFTPYRKTKYKGTYPIVYRSSWELKAFRYLDTNPNILQWGSESTVVRYADPTRDNSVHRYFIDLMFIARDANKSIVKYYVEIKPFKDTQPPKNTKRKKETTFLTESNTYIRNICKWKAAIAFAQRKNAKFALWTEKGVKILN